MCLGDEPFDLARRRDVGDVSVGGDAEYAQVGDGAGEVGFVAGADPDRAALSGQRERGGPADPAAAAGDQCGSAGYPEIPFRAAGAAA